VSNPAIRCFVAMAVGRADTNRIYDKHILPTLRAAGTRFEALDDDGEYNLRRWQNRRQGHKLPRLAGTKNVTEVVARLVLCSLQKVPTERLTSALPSYTANETGKVFMWQDELIVGYLKRLPASVKVYVSDLIKSVPDATMKGQQLKLTIKAEH
jgi:hypothetical protein